MTPCALKIAERIRREGPILFEQFMEQALYDPQYGYYMSTVKRIGREGDFFTSSHLHPVFGRLMGRQIEEMWEVMGRPGLFTVVEMGAGEGLMCGDVLAYLDRTPMAGSLRYVIVERNPAVRDRQQALLGTMGARVSWTDSLDGLSCFSGCFFTNELIDAFPVHLIQKQGALAEVSVGINGDSFFETPGPALDPELEEYFRVFAPELPDGYRTEANLRARQWLGRIAGLLDEGFLLTIDYGYPADEYYDADRNRGTLMCYYRHEFGEDTFLHVGEQDITAHVNFSALKRWGEEFGLAGVGYCSQGSFLISAGIDKEIEELARSSRDYLFELAKVKRLFMPQGLGESHKVLVQCKGEKKAPLRGFSLRNQLKRL
ncbi:MAG: SAM-dependent methyltransferase [Thermodesulfovibrionales bacterium]